MEMSKSYAERIEEMNKDVELADLGDERHLVSRNNVLHARMKHTTNSRLGKFRYSYVAVAPKTPWGLSCGEGLLVPLAEDDENGDSYYVVDFQTAREILPVLKQHRIPLAMQEDEKEFVDLVSFARAGHEIMTETMHNVKYNR